MRESRADTRRALVAALVLHALLFALMFAGMWWTRQAAPVSAAGPVIEADLVDPNALSAPMRAALDAPATPPPEPVPEPVQEPEPVAPPPQPLPEPTPDEAPTPPQAAPQEMLPEPDTREQERVAREAEAARRAEREQEERRRQEQIDLTERKRQEEAERKERLAEQARQKEIAEKLEKIRAEREKAERAERLAQQKLQQIRDAQARAQASEPSDSAASPPPGNNGADPDLLARYIAAINAAIVQNWTRPETVPLGQRCTIVIRQIPGGNVIAANVDPSCPYDELGRRSIEAAVLKAQPLPYQGFETVFSRTLILRFQAADR